MELNEDELRIFNIGLLEDKRMKLGSVRSDIYSLKSKLTEALNEPMDLRQFETITKEIILKLKLKNKLIFEIENLKN
ncbi:hypothetical protein [Campylobacter fetus]|uniref:hypothetical protein n=1 Tax=Campylobacter fetus TaxID=196 RepID=UPI000FCC71FF|nr:hypothetical protein [Campylobacter fetus]RUT49889.1 hypothetical protein BWK67_06000 [Campylobacter fetus]RUT50150.1 hypothetical protein BWK51_05980 [Campylobacter fetus]